MSNFQVAFSEFVEDTSRGRNSNTSWWKKKIRDVPKLSPRTFCSYKYNVNQKFDYKVQMCGIF